MPKHQSFPLLSINQGTNKVSHIKIGHGRKKISANIPRIGGIVSRPEPEIMLMTPGGKQAFQAGKRGTWERAPKRGSLRMAVLPTMSAGMTSVRLSFCG